MYANKADGHVMAACILAMGIKKNNVAEIYIQ
jgi:hypothetical protein